MSSQNLAAAAQDRKARLAQLKNLKRKQPIASETNNEEQEPSRSPKRLRSPSFVHENADNTLKRDESVVQSDQAEEADVARLYLSGRNYDFETGDAKLGFENNPDEGKVTLERQAAELAANVKAEASKRDADNKPLDIFSLQPRKPNWDLKRDLAAKLKILDVQTENAIARLVRERVERQKKAALDRRRENTNGQADEDVEVGMAGTDLVEAMHLREHEAESEARRDKQDAADDAIG